MHIGKKEDTGAIDMPVPSLFGRGYYIQVQVSIPSHSRREATATLYVCPTALTGCYSWEQHTIESSIGEEGSCTYI